MGPAFNLTWQILAGVIVMVLPGLTLSTWFGKGGGDWPARLVDMVGLSVASTALAVLLGYVLGWRFSGVGVVVIYSSLGLLALAGLSLREGGWGDDEPPWAKIRRVSFNTAGRNLLFLIGLAAVLAWRFYQVRELALPAWVDSLHHVLITRIFLERGGVPASLDPYLPVPFYYHFGFHATAAVYTFISGLPTEAAVLVTGQVLNAAVALSVYRLGMVLWGDIRRAGLAALLVGFASQMPAYYATWGRYTLLAGLVILPLGMAAGVEMAEKGANWWKAMRLAVLSGGILLTHYFAALLLALFLVVLGIQTVVRDWRERGGLRGGRFWPMFTSAAVGAGLASPWIWRVWRFTRQYVNFATVLPADPVDSIFFPNYLSYLWRMAGPNRNYLVLALAVIGLTGAVIYKRQGAFLVWSAGLGLASLPWGVRLIPFRPDHAVIVLFLPATLLSAEGLFTIGERASAAAPRLARACLGAAVASVLVWGVRDTGTILNPATILATQADVQAIKWIEENTPAEADFFINVTPWQYGVYRGVDGGWWVPLLSGRRVLLPPVLYSTGEAGYFQEISALAEQASQMEECTEELREFVHSAGFDYLYLVQGRGRLQTAALEGCGFTTLVYEKEGVSIFRVSD